MEETHYQTQQSFQMGLEFDSNTFKSLADTRKDFLARVLFQAKGKMTAPSNSVLGWEYQGGAKKFFQYQEQDLFIQNFSTFLDIPMGSMGRIYWNTQFKYQNERNEKDSALLDVNEDFFLGGTDLGLRFFLPEQTTFTVNQHFDYFNFIAVDNFSYVHLSTSARLSRTIENKLVLGGEYQYSRQNFSSSTRLDQTQSFSFFGQLLTVPFLSVQYSFLDSTSTSQNFSYRNHKISLIQSFVWGENQDHDPKYGLHVIANLQFKKFPSVIFVDSEGQRLLLSDSEDENFNSFVFKCSYHPSKRLSIENKLSYIGDNFSSQSRDFQRITNYIGFRLDI
ncbi:MAG: hypothetical protein R3A11_07655 [Bdellovibrionota bacterium]